MSSALCACGHERRDHIYEEGACRPGFVCPDGCKEYRPMTAPNIGAGRWPMSTDPLAAVIRSVTDLWDEPLDEVHDVPQIVNALLASDWLAAHDAQVRADERQKVAARLADEGTVEKVAEAMSNVPAHANLARAAARAALDVIAGLIGGEDE